ncbi:MAG: cupin domain-containing protein [Candidatus Binatia bacterium]
MELEVIPWTEAKKPREGELKRRLAQDGFEVFRWRDDAGADYQPHAHDHDESLWVIQGAITFGIAGKTYSLGPGDRLMLPHGTVHTAHTGAAPCLYLIGQKS